MLDNSLILIEPHLSNCEEPSRDYRYKYQETRDERGRGPLVEESRFSQATGIILVELFIDLGTCTPRSPCRGRGHPQFIIPFPTALGFSTLTTQHFGLFFTIMNMCMAPAVQTRICRIFGKKIPGAQLNTSNFYLVSNLYRVNSSYWCHI